MQRILALLAFILLCVFLVILLIHVPRVDLICFVLLTLGLAGWDVIRGLAEHRD